MRIGSVGHDLEPDRERPVCRSTGYTAARFVHRVAIRDSVMGAHKPGATFLVVAGLARQELKIEIEAVAAKVD